MVTGYNPKATVAIPSSTCFFNSLLPFTPGINPMRLSVFKSLIFKIGERIYLVKIAASKLSIGSLAL